MSVKIYGGVNLITGQSTESSKPNKFIMPGAIKGQKSIIMYAPVKLMTPEEYKTAMKQETKR